MFLFGFLGYWRQDIFFWDFLTFKRRKGRKRDLIWAKCCQLLVTSWKLLGKESWDLPVKEMLFFKIAYDGKGQRSYQRWLDKRIYKTEMKFWAVLGSRGCREKKLPTAISMQLFEVVFSTFCGQKNILNFF